MPNQTSLKKVIVHTHDGQSQLGFSCESWINGNVRLISRTGEESVLPFENIKSVSFVKDFGEGKENRILFLNKHAPSPWLWARIEMKDGDVLEGRIRNCQEILSGSGFYLWPSDEEAGTERMFVAKCAVKGFCILSG